MTNAAFQYLGRSSDGRTNRWRLTLPCGHQKNPGTTLLSWQHVSCERCGKEYVVDYNAETMEEAE